MQYKCNQAALFRAFETCFWFAYLPQSNSHWCYVWVVRMLEVNYPRCTLWLKCLAAATISASGPLGSAVFVLSKLVSSFENGRQHEDSTDLKNDAHDELPFSCLLISGLNSIEKTNQTRTQWRDIDWCCMVGCTTCFWGDFIKQIFLLGWWSSKLENLGLFWPLALQRKLLGYCLFDQNVQILGLQGWGFFFFLNQVRDWDFSLEKF